jgi:hypothetical protein
LTDFDRNARDSSYGRRNDLEGSRFGAYLVALAIFVRITSPA